METIPLQPLDAENEETIEWPIEWCKESATLKNLLEDLEGTGGTIPVPEVTSTTLAHIGELVSEYLSRRTTESLTATYFEALHTRWQERQQPKPADLLGVGAPPARPEWLRTMLLSIEKEGGMALFDVLLGANYLDIPLVVLAVAHFLADKTAEIIERGDELEKTLTELREIFQVENDFEPEEYEKIKKELSWCMATQPTSTPTASATTADDNSNQMECD